MAQSFYQFVLNKRHKDNKTPIAQFANQAFADPNFPKHTNNFSILSEYFETHNDYLGLMAAFDELWQEYSGKY